MRIYSFTLIFLYLFALVSPSFASLQFDSANPLIINTIHYPPYSILNDNSERRGHDIEIIEAAFKNRGLQIEFKYVPIKRSLKELEYGRAFAMTICGKTEDRLVYSYFTEPVSFFTLGFIYRKGMMDLAKKSWAEIKKLNLTIATVRGFVAEKELNTNNISSYLVVNLDNGIRMTGIGRLKVFYAGMEASSDLARVHNYHKDFEYVRAPGRSYFDNYLCISKKWPKANELLAEFNLGLKAIKQNGTYDNILKKYKPAD